MLQKQKTEEAKKTDKQLTEIENVHNKQKIIKIKMKYLLRQKTNAIFQIQRFFIRARKSPEQKIQVSQFLLRKQNLFKILKLIYL